MFIAKYAARAAPSAFGSSPDRGAETFEKPEKLEQLENPEQPV